MHNEEQLTGIRGDCHRRKIVSLAREQPMTPQENSDFTYVIDFDLRIVDCDKQ
jgi:hypothetical protein